MEQVATREGVVCQEGRAALPYYQAVAETAKKYGSSLTWPLIPYEPVKRLQTSGRVTDVVSRGGSFLTAWILHNKWENPLYEQFDRLLEILHEYDVTLSLGDAIRPGSTATHCTRALAICKSLSQACLLPLAKSAAWAP